MSTTVPDSTPVLQGIGITSNGIPPLVPGES
jgi:hypothetical protein